MRSNQGWPQSGRRRCHEGSRDSGPRAAGRESCRGAYVRLLDSSGEFTAEVPTSATGHFRFFAADGNWTLRTLRQARRQSIARSWPHAAASARSTSTSKLFERLLEPTLTEMSRALGSALR